MGRKLFVKRLYVNSQWLEVAQLAFMADTSITEMRRRLKRFDYSPQTNEAIAEVVRRDRSRPAPSNVSSYNKHGCKS